jgi:hypothetical protein
MRDLDFTKKEKIKTNLAEKKQDKFVFLYAYENKGITLIALVISIIVILILAGIALNVTIGNNGIISKVQTAKLKEEISDAEEEILSGLSTLDSEYYQKASSDSGINIYDIYSISSLQKYVNGKINGFNYNKDGETVVYYTNSKGSYTVKIKDGKATTYAGIYVVLGENANINMSYDEGNNKVQLSTDMQDVVWASLDENIASVNPTTGEVTKIAYGTVTIVGKSVTGEKVYITIWDDDIVNDGNTERFAKKVTVVDELSRTISISASADDDVKACVVKNNNGEIVLKIYGTGNMGTSSIAFDGFSETDYNAVTSIVIEDGVKNITENVFDNFTKNKTLTIASTIETIDAYYLQNQPELEKINYNAKNAEVTVKAVYLDGSATPSMAYSYFYSNNPNTTTSNVVIGEDVETIPCCAFYYFENLKSIKIPSNVKAISDLALAGCSNLNAIYFEEGIESIGNSAFYACTLLNNVILPRSIAKIGYNAFRSCTSLTSIIIPSNVTIIDSAVFANCVSLKSVTLPENVTEIGVSAFYGCTSLTSITIPKNVTKIGNRAFLECDNLKTIYYNAINVSSSLYNGVLIYMNSSSTWMSCYATPFSVTSNLAVNPTYQIENTSIEKIIIGDEVERIPYGIFYNLKNIKEINIPDSVKTIDAYAFYNCNNITTLNLGNGIEGLGKAAFYNCTSLTSITIPENITSIGGYAFTNCTNLKTVYYNPINASYAGVSGASLYPLFYKSGVENLIIGDKVKNIGDGIFSYMDKIKEITLPETLESIGAWSFFSCDSLETVNYNAINCSTDNIYKIVNGINYPLMPFQQQDKTTGAVIVNNIKNIIIGDKVEKINKQLFAYCGIEAITIPSSMNYIDSSAFNNCTKLKDIIIKKAEGSITGSPWTNVSGVTVRWEP